jgi:cell division protein FtsL
MNPFKRRLFGFRIFELTAFACVMAMAFGVYLAKTAAGRERARIANVERQIAEEHSKMKLLRAEVAHLEQPERLGALSSAHLGLQPADGMREALPETLPDIARPAEGKAKAPPVKSNLLPKPEPIPAVEETLVETSPQ